MPTFETFSSLNTELFYCPKLIFASKRITSSTTENRSEILRGAPKETCLGEVCFFLFTTSFTPVLSQNERKLEIERNKKRLIKKTEIVGHLFRPPSIFCNGKSILIYNSFSSFVSTVIYSETPSPISLSTRFSFPSLSRSSEACL